LKDFQIATEELTESISNSTYAAYCYINLTLLAVVVHSTNAEFVARCLQKLNVDSVEG